MIELADKDIKQLLQVQLCIERKIWTWEIKGMKTKPNETCRAKKKKSDMKNSLYRINSR